MADVEIRKPVALRNVPGVELAAVGTWAASTGITTFTPEDMVNAIAALECPGVRNPVIKLGHDEEDSTSGVRWDGEPAVGWIGNMRMDGAKLIGDYMGMPSWLAETDDSGNAVLATAYPDRSIEIRRPFVCQVGHTHPSVITAVALLGVYAPGVGVLKSMQDVYAAFTEPLDDDNSQTLEQLGATLHVHTTVRLAADDEPRQPTAVEKRSGADFAGVQEQWQEALDSLLSDWEDVNADQREQLSAQIAEAVDENPDRLGELTVDSAAAGALLLAAMRDVADGAMLDQIQAAASQGVIITNPGVDDGELEEIAAAIAAAMAASTASTAGRTAAQNLGTGDGKTIAASTVGFLAGLTDRFLRDQLGGALSAAQAAGRFRVLEIAPIGEWYGSEINDARTCAPCKSVDGKKFDTLDEARAAYGSGKYVGCSGGGRCRGQVIATWGTALSAPIRTTVRMSLGGPMPTRPGAVQASVSVEDISRKYYEAAGYSMWITAMHVDPLELIASDDTNGKFYRVPVELKGEEFTFGEPAEVAINYVDVPVAAKALPYRWGNRAAALAAAGLKEGDFAKGGVVKPEPSGAAGETAEVEVAADVSPAGAAIRKMAATATKDETEQVAEATTQTPGTEQVADSTDNPKEASVDAAKIREALGLSADASDDEVRTATLAALPTETAATPPTAAEIGVMETLAKSGQAVLIDKAQLASLVDTAKKGEIAYHQNRKNERDSYLGAAVREGRIPPASLSAYERLWDLDPEGTRQTVGLLSKNIIPVQASGFLGQEVDMNETDSVLEAMYGKAGA